MDEYTFIPGIYVIIDGTIVNLEEVRAKINGINDVFGYSGPELFQIPISLERPDSEHLRGSKT